MRIVVRAADARSARDAQARLAAAGFEAKALIGDGPAPDGEDMSIVVGAGASPPDGGAHLLKLAGLSTAEPPAFGLRPPEDYSGAIALDAPTKLLTAQIDAALRLAVVEEERVRRTATAAMLKAPAPRFQEARKLRALYIGSPSAMFLALERAMTEQGGLVAAAFSSYAGFDHLHDEPFDAVVLNGAENPATAISLCAALRRNGSLYHLATMVVTAPGDAATAAAAFERGASAVAEANAPCGPSLGWLFEAMRRERRRRAAEHDLRAMRDLMGDVRTGLFQRPAFDAHLARLASDHHASGRAMSLAALRVLPAHGARQPSPEVWRRGFTEIASLASRLMRDADCGAAFGADLIAIALPASDLAAAKRTAERIASVAECTAFASGEGSAGPLVFEQITVELQPGESGAGLLARALRSLEIEDVPA
jgi:two-component system cell cycle response regulator PopA